MSRNAFEKIMQLITGFAFKTFSWFICRAVLPPSDLEGGAKS